MVTQENYDVKYLTDHKTLKFSSILKRLLAQRLFPFYIHLLKSRQRLKQNSLSQQLDDGLRKNQQLKKQKT